MRVSDELAEFQTDIHRKVSGFSSPKQRFTAGQTVRCWAATHLLPLDESAATHDLYALASEPHFVGFNAKMVLQEWAAGRLRVP